MESAGTIQILVQSGAIGLCFYLIYINRKQSNGQLNTMIDVIERSTDASVQTAGIMGKFSEKLDELIRRK